MGKTTRDEINLDLDGTIDAAIKKLHALKKKYPDGRINLTSDHEYGESYPRLKLEFTRPKEPVEIEYDMWREKQSRYSELCAAARAYEREGDTYPRAAELAALKEELGCFADNRMSMLQIYDGEVITTDMMRGGRRRDGTWVFRTLGAEYFDQRVAEVTDEPAAKGSAPPDSRP